MNKREAKRIAYDRAAGNLFADISGGGPLMDPRVESQEEADKVIAAMEELIEQFRRKAKED